MNNILQLLKSGMKTLKRERFFGMVNIFGLAIGMFCFLITALYVKDELTHDKWHQHSDRIYLPQQGMITPNGSINLLPAYATGAAWKAESPGVEEVVNISFAKTSKYTVNEIEFETKSLFYSTGALFKVFDFTLSVGDEKTALAEPNSVVISEAVARKHFRGRNSLGEFIEIDGLGAYRVSGVLNKIPSNSHLQFEFILPVDFNKGDYEGLESNWQLGQGLFYLLMDKNYSVDQLRADTEAIFKKNKEEHSAFEFSFLKFSELYLAGSTGRSGSGMFGGQERYIIIFSVVGTLILLVASFNYINLTTSRSFARAKDLVVRKILGASKARLIGFQIGETLFMSILALVIAIISLEVSLPSLNSLIGKNLSLDIVNDPSLLLLPLLLLLLVVMLSGIYPALIGSKLNLLSALKGNSPKAKGSIIRKGLIVLQFAICTGVLATALIIRSQANYLIQKDLGYNTENLLTIDVRRGGMFGKYQAFKNELERSTQIEMVSSGPLPKSNGVMILDIGEGENKTSQFVSYGSADKEFVEIGGLKLISGQSFSQLDESQLENAALINEAALALFDLDVEGAINQVLPGSTAKVVGVLQDFHLNSTKNAISPLLILYGPTNLSNILIRYKAGNVDNVLEYAEQQWDELGATAPFKYELIDTYFEDAFKREETLVSIFDGLTIMLVLIATLGLFALAVFEGQLIEKELSIRKVLGASQASLIKRLNLRFLSPILIAFLVAIPITQYLIKGWLESFAYRIESTSMIYTVSAGVILLLSFSMLTIQGMIGVRKNPVDVLRNE
ncbi:MAG: putative ABC transport system permease protein [Candidatus Endobugula sp.]|jgi:putative ABC transport system permease protein